MNYTQAVAHLYGLGPELAGAAGEPRRRFDLAHMRTLCHALGDPQTRVPAVLIAGTNGKGSTAATLASILSAAGYRPGLYTSPHLIRVNERIQLARPTLPSEYGSAEMPGSEGPLTLTPIADHDYAHLYTLVDNACEQLVAEGKLPMSPSFFERLTALMFLYFAGEERPRADIMVLEVGLGGRLDATNVVEPLLSVLTDIALDHQNYLGDTIAEITREKCGILRREGTLITLPQLPEANETIGLVATALNVHAISAQAYVPPAQRDVSPATNIDLLPASGSALPRNRYTVRVQDEGEPGELRIDTPLAGMHQQRNVALAITAAIALRNQTGIKNDLSRNGSGYKITNAAIEAGIRDTSWPGRLELIAPNVLVDVAHNPAGAWSLRFALASLPANQPRTLVFSCLRDKDLREMSRILFPLFDASEGGDPDRIRDHIVLCPVPTTRSAPVDALEAAAQELQIPASSAADVEGALTLAEELTPKGGLIVITGSVYLVGEASRLLLREANPLEGALS